MDERFATPPDPVALERPHPAAASLLGATAGTLIVLSLFAFLSELGGDHRRVMGLLLSLGFEIIGVAILWLARDRQMATVGVTVSAVGVVPLVFHLFVDTGASDGAIGSVSDLTSTTTSVLVLLAVLWGVAYLVGPGRRYSIFLAGALVAVWLVAVVQVVDDTLDQVVDELSSLGYSSSVERIPMDAFAPDSGQDGDVFAYGDDDPYTGGYGYSEVTVDQPWTRLGVLSLVVGGGYLGLAGLRDRRGDRRMATPLFAVSIPILHVATLFLADDLGAGGTAFLAMTLGGVAIWLGIHARRRFTSWAGVWAVTIGLIVASSEVAGDSTSVFGTVLLVVGLGIAGALYATEGDRSSGSGPRSPLLPVGPAGPGAFPVPSGPAAPAPPPAAAETEGPPAPPWGLEPPTPPAG